MIHFFIFIFVMVVTAILFGSWVMVMTGKFIWHAFTGWMRPGCPAAWAGSAPIPVADPEIQRTPVIAGAADQI